MEQGNDETIRVSAESNELAAQDDSFEMRWFVTRDDWIASNLERFDASEEWTAHFRKQRQDRVAKAGFGTAGVVLIVGLIVNTHYGWTQTTGTAVVVGGIFAVLLAALFASAIGKKDPQAAHVRDIHAHDYSAFVGPTRAWCGGSHVIFERDESVYKLPWRKVHVVASANYLMLRTWDASTYIFPLKVFGDVEVQKRCVERISRWIAEAQPPEAELVKQWLRDRSTPCPKCRYQLANLQGDKCPECGHVLTVDELNARAALRAM